MSKHLGLEPAPAEPRSVTLTTAPAWRGTPLGWRPAARRGGALIVGAGPAGEALAEAIARRPEAGLGVAGFVDDGAGRRAHRRLPAPLLGRIADLPALVAELRPAVVLVEHLHTPDAQALLGCLEGGVEVRTFAAWYERHESRVNLGAIDATWCLASLDKAETRLGAAAKRAIDVALALVGLAATALLLPLIAVAIRLAGGPGPLLYSQARVGYRGRPFTIYKFRTMGADAERAGVTWAAENDARVTPAGRFLRQTRLDELPQFWNVLRGDMTLVGPRPERPEFVGLLEREIPFYGLRHLVMPGVTGWAQVRYPYGASVEDAREKLQYDLYYIKNRSLLLDLGILARTVKVMARKMGAR